MQNLEIQVLKKLDALGIRDQVLLVGVSGGLDSIALVAVLSAIAPRRNLTLKLAHIHHGAQDVPYRNNAEDFVCRVAKSYGVAFVTKKYSGEELKSESQLRDFRLKALEELRVDADSNYVVLAHHANDLLETRMIRLLRGVGPQGLESMTILSSVILRPFLEFSRGEIYDYALRQGLVWIEDPSNQDQEPLRNWIRNVWLPMAEQKRSGATKTLMSSLDSLAQSVSDVGGEALINAYEEGLDRLELASLSFREQRRVLAKYIFSSGLKDYSVTHIDEILKRLDSSQKDFTFTLLKRKWCVDTKRIRVESES